MSKQYVWTSDDALEMMRYGTVWRVVSVKPHVGGGQWIRYRLVKRKGERFDFVGPIKTKRLHFEKTINPGDLLFRDHDTREFSRMQIIDVDDPRHSAHAATKEATTQSE